MGLSDCGKHVNTALYIYIYTAILICMSKNAAKTALGSGEHICICEFRLLLAETHKREVYQSKPRTPWLKSGQGPCGWRKNVRQV